MVNLDHYKRELRMGNSEWERNRQKLKKRAGECSRCCESAVVLTFKNGKTKKSSCCRKHLALLREKSLQDGRKRRKMKRIYDLLKKVESLQGEVTLRVTAIGCDGNLCLDMTRNGEPLDCPLFELTSDGEIVEQFCSNDISVDDYLNQFPKNEAAVICEQVVL